MTQSPGLHLRLVWSAFVVLLLSSLSMGAAQAQVGERVSNFELPDLSGTTHSLANHTGKVVVLAFWSFKCPVSLAYDDRLSALRDKFQDRGVAVLAIASNANESTAEIERNAANLNLRFAILLDRDGVLADRLGATHTPSVFILDPDRTLRYRGSLDNNKGVQENGRVAYAEEALEALLAGRPVAQSDTRVFGCTIKRKH